MNEQLKRGGLRYISFFILDIICLIIANVIAVWVYLNTGKLTYDVADYARVVMYMIVIDIIVSITFNTLKRALRRRKKKELVQCAKHVCFSFVTLALLLFSSKQGAEFSRVTIYLAYGLYFLLIIICRIAWKELLKIDCKGKGIDTVLLITTYGYAGEGLGVVENAGMNVKGIFLTDKKNESIIRNIPTIVGRRDAAAFLCWEWIDRVYICGPDSIDVPESILKACKEMGIPVYTAPATKSFEYEVIKIRTALQKDDKKTGLSFFESEHDIPFPVRRLYTIFESEQDNQKGFHAHKQSWHLLFCPYGSIDVMVDTGKERKTVSLSDPSIGLILHPSIWREMFWKRTG
ncbi:MAG: WxcM-like domain-containing protein, partial [Lachnospiraceae bacterium]|nr:WxcM-like domain-containing protein [Lachnospiraceae bacterium]